MPSLSPGKRAKTWGAGPGDMGGVARVCVDCFMQRALTHWKEADAAREQQLNEAFRSWDTNGDGELQYDEWVEGLSFSNPGVPTRTITKVYKAAFAGNIIDLSRFTRLMLSNGLQMLARPPTPDEAPGLQDAGHEPASEAAADAAGPLESVRRQLSASSKHRVSIAPPEALAVAIPPPPAAEAQKRCGPGTDPRAAHPCSRSHLSAFHAADREFSKHGVLPRRARAIPAALTWRVLAVPKGHAPILCDRVAGAPRPSGSSAATSRPPSARRRCAHGHQFIRRAPEEGASPRVPGRRRAAGGTSARTARR